VSQRCTAADYQIVSYRPEYISKIVEVQRDLWGPDEDLNAAYLSWKYLQNPHVSEPLIYLAMRRERVVGMRGFVGSEWQFGSPRQRVVLPLAADAVIAPDHRNRGLMTLLMEIALKDLTQKGYKYVLSMEARRVTVMSQVTTGWRSVGSLQPMERQVARSKSTQCEQPSLRNASLTASVYRRLRNIAGKMHAFPRDSQANQFHVLDSISSRCNQEVGRHIMIEKAPRPRDMMELASRLDDDGRIRQVRNEEYYYWRFQNPRSKYRFLFWSDSKMEGYLVLQTTAFPSDEPIRIIDWEATSDRVRLELLNAAIQLVPDYTLLTWSATLSEKEHRILEAAGFQRLDHQIASTNPSVALVRPVCDEMLGKEWVLGSQRLLDIGNWDFRMIHSRGF
jgi:GNAT superfamily N-acetyltransferase